LELGQVGLPGFNLVCFIIMLSKWTIRQCL